MEPKDFYTNAQRKLQSDNESTKLADTIFHAVVTEELQPEQIGFIASRDFFFLSTVDAEGQPSVSYKGGPVGAVHVISPTQLAFPNYDGNGMFFSMGNISESNKVGLLFMDIEQTPLRIRVQGEAVLSEDPELMTLFPSATVIVIVDISSVFHNCARYIHKHTRTETSKYVPDENGDQPFPVWKRVDAVQDSLLANDIGKAESEGGTITLEDYADHLSKGTS